MIAGTWMDPVLGVDIHWVLVPAPPAPPIPTPLPHPFVGIVYDPIGLAVGTAISAGISLATDAPVTGPVLINCLPASNTGTEGTNKMTMPHIPTPPGISWAMVPAGLKPPIPGKGANPGVAGPTPSNDAIIITGSKTVHTMGTNATRLGDIAMSCGEPIRLPSSTVLAIPKGPPVLIGGPPALDFAAAAFAAIRTSWVSGRLNALASKIFGEGSRAANWASKIICFFTGHPVDVVTGMVMSDHTDLTLPGPIPFVFQRTYYSRSEYSGPLGRGWAHSYDQFIRLESERIVYHDGDGREIYFAPPPSGVVARNEVERLDLVIHRDFLQIHRPDGTILEFRGAGRADGTWPLVRIRDWSRRQLTAQYDDRGQLISITDSAGRLIRFLNDASGRLVAIDLPHPEDRSERVVVLRLLYGDDGDLLAVSDALGAEFRYEYDRHLLVAETRPNGYSYYFAYDGADASARCVRTWGADGAFDHQLIYDLAARRTVVVDSRGSARIFAYENGLVVNVTDPLGGVTQYEWSEAAKLLAQTDATGHRTAYSYDSRGNCNAIEDADGSRYTFAFNHRDQLIAFTDPVRATWQWSYAADNSALLSTTDPLGRFVHYHHRDDRLIGFDDESGRRTEVEYDEEGNLRSLRTPDGAQLRWKHDSWGRNTVVIDPAGNSRLRSFDLCSRVIRVEEADGNVREMAYDAEGRVVRARDRHEDNVLEYSGAGWLLARVQNGRATHFSYDNEGALVGVVAPNNANYRFVLDAAGRVVKEVDFDGETWRYQRDALGRPIRLQQPSGLATTYKFDPLGRVSEIRHSDGSFAEYTYDSNGQLMTAANAAAQVGFERDAIGRVIGERQNSFWVTSSYGAHDLRNTISSSQGFAATITRDVMGAVLGVRCRDVVDSVARDWQVDFVRDSTGLEIERRLAGGVVSSWQRDIVGRPARHSITVLGRQTFSRRFEWEPDNRLRMIADEPGRTMQFRFSPGGFLTEAIGSDGSHVFRTAESTICALSARESDVAPSGHALAAGAQIFDYDHRGQRTAAVTRDGEKWQYEWDGFGMLRQVRRPDGELVTFAYDALGRRITKTCHGTTTQWIWDGNKPLHEWVAVPDDGHDGAVVPPTRTSWVFHPDTHEPLARLDRDQTLAIVSDAMGAPERAFDDMGRERWAIDYGPCRDVAVQHGDEHLIPFRGLGQYYDAETGLYYNRFRYYDPDSGQYLTPDPLGLIGGLSLYAYAADPFSQADPFGLSVTKELADNLGAASRPVAPGQTPHHIVQRNGGGTHGAASRRLLDRNGIGIHSASNGARQWGTHPNQVLQPAHPGRLAPDYHGGSHLHGDAAQRLIYRILRAAEKKGLPVADILEDIGRRMEAGTWEDSFKGCH